MEGLTAQLTPQEAAAIQEMADARGISIEEAAQQAIQWALDARYRRSQRSGQVTPFRGPKSGKAHEDNA